MIKWEQIVLLFIGVILITMTFVGYSYFGPHNILFVETTLYVSIALTLSIAIITIYNLIRTMTFSKIYIIVEAVALAVFARHYLDTLKRAAVREHITVEFMFSKGMYIVLLLIPISIILQYFFQTQKRKNSINTTTQQ